MNLRLAVVCASLAFIFSALPASADEAADLLAKHKTFAGWQFGDGAVKTLTIDSNILNSATNAVSSKLHEVRVGPVNRVSEESSEGISDNGFTGQIFWSTSINGFTRPVRGDVVKWIVAMDVLFGEGTSLLTGTMRGQGTVDGKSVSIVRVNPPSADTIDLYVDPATGAYARAVVDPGGTYDTTVDILGYDDVLPGKKLISKWKYGTSKYIHQNTKAIANATISNEQLHPPAPRAHWDFSNDQAFPIEFNDKRIIVNAKVNGVSGRFILDTGASSIALSRLFADKAGVKRVRAETFSGIAGTLRGEYAKADTVEVGGNVLHDVLVGAGGQAIDPDAPDGLLGFDLFAGAIVKLDLDNKKMTIQDPQTHPADRNAGLNVAVDLSNGVPQIPMKINDRVTVNTLWDSGSPYHVLFSHLLLSKYGINMLVDDSTLGSHLTFSGVGGGEDQVECGNLDSMSVGPIVYQHAPACASRQSVDEKEAIVGLDFLKAFNMIFDYPDSYLILIPRK